MIKRLKESLKKYRANTDEIEESETSDDFLSTLASNISALFHHKDSSSTVTTATTTTTATSQPVFAIPSSPDDERELVNKMQRMKVDDLRDLEERAKTALETIHTTLVQRMEEELEKARDAKECSVCMDGIIDTVFVPCMHMTVCRACAKKIFAGKERRCPSCRATIQKLAKVFVK